MSVSVKRQRVEPETGGSLLLSDDVWLLVWSFMNVYQAAMQRRVCRRFRDLLSGDRRIPRTINVWNYTYECHPKLMAFLSHYSVHTAALHGATYLPSGVVYRARALSAASTFKRINVVFGARYEHRQMVELTEWLSAARRSVTYLELPFGGIFRGQKVGYECFEWRNICENDFRSLTVLDLGLDHNLSDQHLYPLIWSSWIGSLTTLTLHVSKQQDDDCGVERLFRECTSLTTLVLRLDDSQWMFVAAASKLKNVTLTCASHVSDASIESLLPLQHLETLTLRGASRRPSAAVLARFARLLTVRLE